MDEIKLTKEQEKIVFSEESKFVVPASAGSGKTRVLVERYLHLVEGHELSPDRILAITFTKKAAAEMKERIVKRLRSKGHAKFAQVAETGPIQTIHSFCERVLRENAFAAGIDPEFEIAEHFRHGREDAVATTIANLEDDDREALAVVSHWAGKRGYRNKDVLEDTIREAIQELRATDFTPSEFLAAFGSPTEVLRSWRRAILQDLEIAGDWDLDDLYFETRINELSDKKRERLFRNPDAEIAAAEFTAGLAQIVARSWGRLEAMMRQEQAFDFTLLERLAVDLLRSDDQVCERLRRQYQAVLVDESQDMSPLQHELVALMKPHHLMMVGDAQQSIYAFRHADVALFRETATRLPNLPLTKSHRSPQDVQLFVDRVFNALWGPEYRPMAAPFALDLDAPSDIEYPNVEIWETEESNWGQFGEWIADTINRQELQPGQVAILVRTGKEAVRLKHELRNHEIDSILVGGAEQFFARLEVRDMANAIRALCDPSDRHALLATLRSPFVGLGFDAWIRVVATHSTDSSELEDLPEDATKLAKFHEWFDPIAQFADRYPAWEIMAKLLTSSPILENLARQVGGRQAIANVRKLLTLATGEPSLGPLQYADRIQEIQKFAQREPEAQFQDDDGKAVRICTIHSAKGLEFSHVFVVNMTPWPSKSDFYYDRRYRLFLASPEQDSGYKKWLRKRATQREDQEGQRLFYVALTRAKERLYLEAQPKGTGLHLRAEALGACRHEPNSGND